MANLLCRAEWLLQSLVKDQRVCPHCGSRNVRVVARKALFIRIKRCGDCLLLFTGPIYRPWFTRSIYGTIYDGAWATRWPDPQELERAKESRFVGSPVDFGYMLKPIAALCAGGSMRLLEIGSAWGYTLYQAQQHGFRAVGIEINPLAARFGTENLGVRIVNEFSDLPEEPFDVAVAWHSLEHFVDLSAVFKELRDHLRPQGHLVIGTPNIDPDRLGKGCLVGMGAVHPLGFNLDFHKLNLPRYGFSIKGIYDDADDFPGKPCAGLPGPAGIIVWAQKN